MKNSSNNTGKNNVDLAPPTPEFTDTGQWKSGAQTAAARRKCSEVSLVHGGRKAEEIFRKGGDLSAAFRDIWDQVLAEAPEVHKAIENGGLIGQQAQRYVGAEVVRRIWEAGLQTVEDWDRMAYFSGGFGRWETKADKMGQDLQEALKAENSNVLDYEVMTNDTT